jgi:hypothetical protein
LIAGIDGEVLRDHFQQLLPALCNVVVKQFDAVDGHKAQEGLVAPFEVTLAVSGVDCRELACEHWDEEVTGAARRFEESGVDALRFVLH